MNDDSFASGKRVTATSPVLSYSSKTAGIGGTLKQQAEDFRVEEIDPTGQCLAIDTPVNRPDEPGRFVHFVLQKKDWTTTGAIKAIAKRLWTTPKRFNFAGNKDRTSVSTQRCSAFAMKKEEILGVRVKDIRISGAWYATDKVRLGQLIGNRFTVTVRDGENDDEKIQKIYREMNGKIPNYFGEQRFGSSRRHTHVVGEKILQGRTEEAAWMYLTDNEGEENEMARQARQALVEHRDFAKAVTEFPRHLTYERTLLTWLAEHPTDFINAFRKLPRNLLLLFIHAFQADLFNRMLSERLADGPLEIEEGEYFCGENSYGFPDIENKAQTGWIAGKLIGHETKLNERERIALEKTGIEQRAFRLPHMPEIHSAGTYRPLLVPLKNFSFQGNDHSSTTVKEQALLHANDTFRFDLPSGSYATMALREFLDDKKN